MTFNNKIDAPNQIHSLIMILIKQKAAHILIFPITIMQYKIQPAPFTMNKQTSLPLRWNPYRNITKKAYQIIFLGLRSPYQLWVRTKEDTHSNMRTSTPTLRSPFRKYQTTKKELIQSFEWMHNYSNIPISTRSKTIMRSQTLWTSLQPWPYP